MLQPEPIRVCKIITWCYGCTKYGTFEQLTCELWTPACLPCVYLHIYVGLENKGTVSVISRNPTCKDNSVRFTTVPLKALSDQCLILIIPVRVPVVDMWQDPFVQKPHFSFKMISLDIFNLDQNKHLRVQLGSIMLQSHLFKKLHLLDTYRKII